MIGTTLSHYKILEKIGQGGMGEVYLAQDTTLDRKVALKFLPEELEQDPTTRKRFLREAKSAAALDHPYVCQIHEVGEVEGKSFISMEYVQGTTLKEKLTEGPLPLKEALQKATEIAEALEEAHKQGIVHRDVKPANIMLTPQGHVKVMDFGLAKRVTPVEGQEQEITTALTQQGSSLGTVPYMSPEQVRGQEVDTRSDIFSFGVVLYEMLTGVNPFGKGSAMDTATAILTETTPPLSRYTEDIPVLLQHTVKKMLAKEPDSRYQLIHDVRTDLGELMDEIEKGLAEPTTASPIGQTRAGQAGQWRRTITLGLVALAGVALGVALWSLTRPSTPPQLNKLVVTPSPEAPLAEVRFSVVAISSNGRRIVYVAESQGTRQLHLRSLDEFVATPIPGTEGVEGHPFFSPDGESVAFAAAGQLKKVSLMGGSPMTLCDLEGGWAGGSWFEDTIVFGTGGDHIGLYRVSAAGGEPDILATPDPETVEAYFTPEVLPGGKAVLFTIAQFGPDTAQIAVLSLETGKREIVLDEGTHAHYLPTGHLAYLGVQGDLMAVSFDAASLEVSGEAVPVLEGVRRYGNDLDYALSPAGALIYVPDQEYRYTPVWVDRLGTETVVTQEKREYSNPRISPDGKRVFFSLRTTGSPGNAVIYDLEQDSFSRLTLEGAGVSGGMWTPDGKWITFRGLLGGQSNIYRQLADRSAPPEQLTTYTDPIPKNANSWSPEGRVLIVSHAVQFPPIGWDLLILDTEANEEPQPFITSPNHECCARFSPDGKWLAYVSNELGLNHVYVRPYPGPDIKFLVSEEAEGGGEPVWSPHGRELFYRSGDRMMAVSIQTEPTFRAGRPEVLFEGSYRATPVPAGLQYYDISPDGQRFLMIKRERELAQINVVLNWFEELKRLVP